MKSTLWYAVLMLLFLTHPIGAAADAGGMANAALRGLEVFTVEAIVDGPEVGMLVTEAEIEAEMSEVLTQAGIWSDRIGDLDFRGGRLQLVFRSYSVEPVLPEAHDQPVQIFPISVYLAASRPLYLGGDGEATEVEAQVWWTHVEAWALQRTMHSVACLAVRRALDQFLEAHAAAQQAGRPAASRVPAAN